MKVIPRNRAHHLNARSLDLRNFGETNFRRPQLLPRPPTNALFNSKERKVEMKFVCPPVQFQIPHHERTRSLPVDSDHGLGRQGRDSSPPSLPLSLSSRLMPWSQTPNPNLPLMDPPSLQNKWSKAVCPTTFVSVLPRVPADLGGFHCHCAIHCLDLSTPPSRDAE